MPTEPVFAWNRMCSRGWAGGLSARSRLPSCCSACDGSRGAERSRRLIESARLVARSSDFGVASGACERDPSADLRDSLKPVQAKHHPAITDPKRTGELLCAIGDYQGLPVTRAALRLVPLVFQRPGEVRHAEWAEFDLDSATWTIPAGRMKRTKAGKADGPAHIVPLSAQAVAVLHDLHPVTGHGRFVLPSPRSGGGRGQSVTTPCCRPCDAWATQSTR